MAEAKKWVAGAIKHPGAFSRKAKEAGMSTSEYARKEEHAPGTLGKQARLAETLEGMHHKHEAEHKEMNDRHAREQHDIHSRHSDEVKRGAVE